MERTSPIQTGGQNSLAFAAIVFAAIRRHTGWWPATVAIASYLLPKQEGVTSNCSKGAICCNYLERILTPCPAYLCSLKYLGFFPNKPFLYIFDLLTARCIHLKCKRWYRGARLIVPRFWNSKFERIRGIWTIEPLRGLLIEHHSKEG